MEKPNTQDIEWITQVMGRPLAGDFMIARRTKSGHPQVLRVPPVVEGKPFPSLYWLCCPLLKKQIDHLEARGVIKELEREVEHTPALLEALKNDHLAYREERLSLLSEQLKAELLHPEQMIEALETKGIGGIEDFSRIRCLHMHYAYHLIRSTTLGHLLDQRFNLNSWA